MVPTRLLLLGVSNFEILELGLELVPIECLITSAWDGLFFILRYNSFGTKIKRSKDMQITKMIPARTKK